MSSLVLGPGTAVEILGKLVFSIIVLKLIAFFLLNIMQNSIFGVKG
jgi:hypothetical protein